MRWAEANFQLWGWEPLLWWSRLVSIVGACVAVDVGVGVAVYVPVGTELRM